VRTSIFVAGLVILVIGLATLFVPGLLLAGAVIAIIGVVVAGVGAALKRPEKPVPPTPAKVEEAMAPGAMEAMVRMLAQAPESQRRETIRTRLSTFLGMNDSERADAMKMMMAALQKLDPGDLKKITYTRLEALAEDFDPAARKRLMGTHMMVLMGLPKEQMMADINAMVSVMGQCHEQCRMKIMGTMRELMMEMPQDKRAMMMQMLPIDVQKMLMGQ
jgi:hypothetical protein